MRVSRFRSGCSTKLRRRSLRECSGMFPDRRVAPVESAPAPGFPELSTIERRPRVDGLVVQSDYIYRSLNRRVR
jgi:hypothetical protein